MTNHWIWRLKHILPCMQEIQSLPTQTNWSRYNTYLIVALLSLHLGWELWCPREAWPPAATSAAAQSPGHNPEIAHRTFCFLYLSPKTPPPSNVSGSLKFQQSPMLEFFLT